MPPLIETSRLLLRRITIEDLDELAAIHAEPQVERFLGPFDRARLIDWVEQNRTEWSELGYGRLAIVDRKSGRLLGRTGLKYWPQFDETEVGWVLRPDAWGRGLATEAARACIDWGFGKLDIPYLTAMIQPANARSIAVAARLGMSPLRQDVLMGEPVTVYSKSRRGWGQHHA